MFVGSRAYINSSAPLTGTFSSQESESGAGIIVLWEAQDVPWITSESHFSLERPQLLCSCQKHSHLLSVEGRFSVTTGK